MARERRIVEGEMFGAPVPGGWPDRGPVDAIMRRLRRRRRADDATYEGDSKGDAEPDA